MSVHPLASYQHPITDNQALLKGDLTLMSPMLDEPHAHPDAHAHTHETLSAILQSRLKPHERGKDKGDVSSFEMARAWLDMKRVGECLGEQKAGAMREKGRGRSRAAVVEGGAGL